MRTFTKKWTHMVNFFRPMILEEVQSSILNISNDPLLRMRNKELILIKYMLREFVTPNRK